MFLYKRHITSPEKALSGIYSLRRSYLATPGHLVTTAGLCFQQCVTTGNPARASTVSIKTLDILSLPRRCRLGRNHERSLDMLNRRCYGDITKNERPLMQVNLHHDMESCVATFFRKSSIFSPSMTLPCSLLPQVRY